MTGTDRSFAARRIGTTGHEIVSPQGEVVAWTVDERWAAIVVALLNGAPHQDPGSLRSARRETPCADNVADTEATAREAISHLAYDSISLQWNLPGELSEAVRSLVATYFQDGEIVRTLGNLACRYVMKALADDHLGITGIEFPGIDSAARNERDGTRPSRSR
jgi:hypothetical protein